jgi:hypothetical protein
LSEENNRGRILIGAAEEILAAMGTVSKAAGEALSQPDPDFRAALVRPSNMMVGDARPERFQLSKNAERRAELSRLVSEPFVARVDVEWLGGGPHETYYFARRSAAGLLEAINGAKFVPVGLALGALAEHEVGEIATIETNDRERKGRVLYRAVLSPKQQKGLWDAILTHFEIHEWGEIIEFLRAESLRLGLRRSETYRLGTQRDG